WYENDGSENFTSHTITTSAGSARSVYASDIDGDGDIDVLSASENDDNIAWYENSLSIKVMEGETLFYDFNASDADGDNITYTLVGDDKEFFEINSTTGILELKSVLDFENPDDANGDGIYELSFVVCDSSGVASKENKIKVKLTDEYMDNVSTLSSNETTTVINSSELNITVFDDDLQTVLPLKATDYTATIINGSEYATISDGVLTTTSTKHTASIDVLYEFKDLKYVKNYTLLSFDDAPLNALDDIKTSYESTPFNIEVGNTYQDELSDTNSNDLKTRWFSFDINDTGVYKLFYLVDKGSLKEKSDTEITYELYKNEQNFNGFIGSRSFDASENFYLDLALDANTTYYLKFQTVEDIWKVQYKIGLLEYLLNDDGVYYKKFVLDEDGKSLENKFVIPQDTSYIGEFVSIKEFGVKLNGKDLFETNSTQQTIEARYKEGLYSLSIYGEPYQEVYLNLNYAKTDVEMENNSNIFYSNIYNGLNTYAAIDNSDVDYISFVSSDENLSVDVEVDGEINGYETFKLSIYDIGGGQLASESFDASMQENKLNFDFGYLNKSGYIKEDSFYILKIEKINFDESTSLDYSFVINGAKRVLSSNEEAYTALYKEYIAGDKTLDENLNIITTKSDDVGSLIILTGDSDNPDDTLYDASQKLSQTYYKQFEKRGFLDSDIYWINGDTKTYSGVDDSNISVSNFLSQIEEESNNDKTGPLYIYMVDHGSNGSFKISNNDIDADGSKEILFASELKVALDSFISKTERDVVVIIEACKSGSFIPTLTNNYTNDKIAVITSSKAGELSYIDAFGNISFTKFLSDNILSGKTLNSSYEDAKERLNTQGSVYASQEPIYYIPTDALKNLRVGGSFAAASMNLSFIESYTIDGESNQTLTQIDLYDKKTISLTASVTSGSGISKVWATIITPDYTPPSIEDGIFETPQLDKYTVEMLYDDATKAYKAIYTITSASTYSGLYDITIYIEDNDGLVYSLNEKIDGVGEVEYTPSEEPSTDDTKKQFHLQKGGILSLQI
ncbi:MAG: cadherin domain-containing protein, partial [Campylobacterales bacterium]|nr:cadherin domain-containing protein [Campylobacterales bacterium]